jgi:inner membrane transporter RhtA
MTTVRDSDRGNHSGWQQGAAAPTLAALLGLVSVQTGAAIGKSLFPLVGAEGVAALRLGLSALVLALVFRPWQLWGRASWRDLLAYGLTMGLMNLLIYRAFSTIPVSIAVAIEVIGPLGAALVASRRPVDFLWIGLSLLGLALLPLGAVHGRLDPAGVAYALGAALCWGLYIFAGARVARHGNQAVAAGMLVAALFIVPLGAAQSGTLLLSPAVLAVGLGIAILSSMLPYVLDMFAMRHLPANVFGVLLSASPAVSAVAGWLILGEVLSALQFAGIACVSAACAGSTLTRRPTAAAPATGPAP